VIKKRCLKCGVEKSSVDFYKHSKMADGLLGKCKECTKACVRAHRISNHQKVCAYDRARSARKERKEKVAEYQRRRRIRCPEKTRARNAVSNAIRDGRLKRRPCVHCGSLRVQAHHHDYSRPLDIVWVCFTCHREHEHGQHVEDPSKAREGVVKSDVCEE
jgi:hypothetical protein